MNIVAECPFCGTSYQVEHALRGHLIRCPNGSCKKIFTVPKDADPPARSVRKSSPPRKPSGSSQRSGAVGDMVPMLPAEQMPPPTVEKKPADGDWWQAAPPVRSGESQPSARSPAASPPPASPARTGGDNERESWWREAPPPARSPQARSEPPAQVQPTLRHQPAAETISPAVRKSPARSEPQPSNETQPVEIPPLEVPDQPIELPPGEWEPPPVRRGPDAEAIQTVEDTEFKPTHRPRVSKRGACILIAAILFATFGILAGLGVWVWRTIYFNEEKLAQEAQGDYDQGSYGNAAEKFGNLAKNFSSSERVEEYRFMADWSGVRSAVADPGDEFAAAVEKLDSFLKDNKKNPYMEKRAPDAGQALLKLTRAFAERNASPANDELTKVMERIEQLRRRVLALGPEALSRSDSEQIDTDLSKVRLGLRRWRERQDLLAQLKMRNNEKAMDAIKRVRALVAQKERELPGLGQDAEVRAGLNRLYDTHMASVVYQPQGEDDPPPRKLPDGADESGGVVFAPLLPTAAPGKAPVDDPVVLALVRGVLYALKRSNGELKWCKRVGIDTTVLPQRVPRSQATPELLLVLSADTQTLTALSVAGGTLWEYHVGKPVLGRPIIIDHRAYLAAYDGDIHEIELAGGHLLGRYPLGQRLTNGGAREGDSNLIYFPGDDSCIYILDVANRRCVNILYDGHPSGSLRSEPVIIPPEGEGAPGYLILNQASGLDAMRLRVFELPVQERHASPLPLRPPAALGGWTWFEPYQDGEKLAVLSDAGILGLFGIRQQGNLDQALFPLLEAGGLNLLPFLHTSRRLPGERGRAQVVHMQGNDLWVLAHGRFQQVRLRWNNATGLEAVAGWKEPLSLGSPLHEPQRFEDRNTGRSTFFLVTQSLEQQICQATAVDEDGKVLWQRQLGLVCEGEPLTLTPPEGGAPLLLALDEGGGLFDLDSTAPLEKLSSRQNLAPALDDNPLVRPRLLLAADGKSAYEIAAPGEGRKLTIRRIEWIAGQRKLRVKQREVSLVSAAGSVMVPAGAPAIVGSQLIVPMTDGTLMRLPLPLPEPDVPLQTGPTWRDRLAPSDAVCHLLALGGDRFLATDGRRGFVVWEWSPGKEYQVLPPGGADTVTQLPVLTASAPVLLPAQGDQQPRVALVDAADALHLLFLGADGSLTLDKKYELKGKLTAGPYVQKMPNGAAGLLCVVEQRQLIWLDAGQSKPRWIYRGDEAILGSPQLIDGSLIVAFPSGRYRSLDPSTGKPQGDGYTLHTSAAPAVTPAAFGPGRLLAPLSDGTALLLTVDELRQPAKK